MRILAIDPGSSCGFAVSNGPSGVWQLAPARGESPGVRYIRLRMYLEDTHRAFPDLRLVVLEAAHHRGAAATEYAIGILTTVQTWCAERGLEHATVHSASLKRFATGKGNATKDEMREHGRRIWQDVGAMTDDEIDARWIRSWALAQYAVQTP